MNEERCSRCGSLIPNDTDGCPLCAADSAPPAAASPIAAKSGGPGRKAGKIVAILLLTMISAGLIGSLSGLFRGCGESKRRYKTAVRLGDDFLREGRLSMAKTAFEAALASKPDDAYATGRLAAIESILRLYEEAVARGNAYEKAEKYAEAKAAYMQAIMLNRDGFDAKLGLFNVDFKRRMLRGLLEGRYRASLEIAMDWEDRAMFEIDPGKSKEALRGAKRVYEAALEYERELGMKPGDTDTKAKLDAVAAEITRSRDW